MAHITADRVRDTSTSTSTGNFVVSGTAPSGFRTLSAVLSVSDTFYYAIQSQGANEWEVGTGTYSSANTFARTTVLSSSNSGSAVNFSAGTKDVFLTLAAAKTVQLDNNGSVSVGGNLSSGGTVSMSSSFLRNRIINGNFDIWQRGTSFTMTNGFVYSADRWYSGAASGTVTRQTFANGQTEVPGNPTYYARYIISTNSQNYEWQQRIEGVSSFAGQTATVSFYARQTTGTVTLGGRIVQDFGTGGSPSSSVVTALGNPSLTTSWQKFTFTVAVPSISGKTIGTDKNDNVWLSLQVSNTGTGTIDFAQFQMEVGSVATPFENLQLAQIVQQCQRFYQKSYAIDVVPGTSTTGGYATNPGHAGGTGNSRANIRFATEMRAAPTLAYWDLVGNINRSSTFVSNNTQSNNISSASFSLTGIGTSGFAFNNAGGTGSAGVGAWASAVHWTASAEF